MNRSVMALCAALAVHLAGIAPAIAGKDVAVEKINADPVLTFESAEGPKNGAIARADFPSRVTLIDPRETDMGRMHLLLPDGRDIWVLGRHLTLEGREKRALGCDQTLAAAPALGVRGGMERCTK